MDAIQLIKKDHAAVERLFKQFERAEARDQHAQMRSIVRKLVKELSVHATIEEQALYPALQRLEARGWIAADWGVSDNNRKAKFYSLTRAGRRHLEEETSNWERFSAAVGAILQNA